MMAESDGLIIRDYRTFWMGHKGDIEHTYTLNKGLSKDILEKMGESCAKVASKCLATTKRDSSNHDMMLETFDRQFLTMAGYTEKETSQLGDLSKLSAQNVQDLIQKKSMKALGLNGNTKRKVLPEMADSLRHGSTEQFFSVFGILPPIPFDFEVMKRFSLRKIPFRIERLGPFETAIIRLVQTLYPVTVPGVHKFQEIRTQAEKVPIRNRILDIDRKLDSVRRELEELATLRRRNKFRRQRTLTLYALIITTFATLAVAYLSSGPANSSVLSLLYGSAAVLVGAFAFFYITQISRYRTKASLDQERITRHMKEMEYELRRLLDQKKEYETLLETRQPR